MANLKDLNLTNEQVGEDLDYAGIKPMGSYAPPLPPGPVRLRLPAKMGDIWESVVKDGKTYLKAVFDQNAPLIVVQATDTNTIGDPYNARLTNIPRPRGKDKLLISDMDFLLKALGHKGKPKTNPEYAAALLQYAGQDFPAKNEWQWYCNDKKDIYVSDGQGGSAQVPGTPGCGRTYYQKDVDKVNGTYPERITCECGASIRAFPQLGSIG